MSQVNVHSRLEADAFSSFGNVIQVPAHKHDVTANQGTARRFNHLARVVNLPRAYAAKVNLCLFDVTPTCKRGGIFNMTLLERHPYSTQTFIPMQGDEGSSGEYLVIVCHSHPTEDRPDLSTLYVAIANASQGIHYHPGTWHHPLVALYKSEQAVKLKPPRIPFACLVHENGVEKEDTQVVRVTPTILHIPHDPDDDVKKSSKL